MTDLNPAPIHKVTLRFFKRSGKWYTDGTARTREKFLSDQFMQDIADTQDAMREGWQTEFYVATDTSDDFDGFLSHLFLPGTIPPQEKEAWDEGYGAGHEDARAEAVVDAMIEQLPELADALEAREEGQMIGDDGQREELCEHGVGHPVQHDGEHSDSCCVHTCDGCCMGLTLEIIAKAKAELEQRHRESRWRCCGRTGEHSHDEDDLGVLGR